MTIFKSLPRLERLALATLLTGLSLVAWLSLPQSTQAALAGNPTEVGWSAYNGNVDGDHYSELKQINAANAHLLKQVWRIDVASKGTATSPMISVSPLALLTTTPESPLHLDRLQLQRRAACGCAAHPMGGREAMLGKACGCC